jgi:hypothetical protein
LGAERSPVGGFENFPIGKFFGIARGAGAVRRPAGGTLSLDRAANAVWPPNVDPSRISMPMTLERV